MLGVKTYPKEYIESCRGRVDADIAAYRSMATLAQKQLGSKEALRDFEARFFNNTVLPLDAFFVHRRRTVEGKDGNPVNEVRVLCNSMLENGNLMTPEKSIKLVPAKSVLKLEFGETIRPSESDFLAPADAYFAEIEVKFS